MMVADESSEEAEGPGKASSSSKGGLPRDFFKMGTIDKDTAPGFERDEDEDQDDSS